MRPLVRGGAATGRHDNQLSSGERIEIARLRRDGRPTKARPGGYRAERAEALAYDTGLGERFVRPGDHGRRGPAETLAEFRGRGLVR